MAKTKVFLISAALVLVAGLLISMLRGKADPYVQSSSWRSYKGVVSFEYPSNWQFNACGEGPTFRLPGSIRGTWEHADRDPLLMYGTVNGCKDGQLVPHIVDEGGEKSSECNTSERGERLRNGLYIHADEHSSGDDRIWLINIRQDTCLKAQRHDIADFSFTSQADDITGENILKNGGEPRVLKRTLLDSPQYKDVKRLAESIRY